MWNYFNTLYYIHEVLKKFVRHNFKIEIRDVYIFATLNIFYCHTKQDKWIRHKL